MTGEHLIITDEDRMNWLEFKPKENIAALEYTYWHKRGFSLRDAIDYNIRREFAFVHQGPD